MRRRAKYCYLMRDGSLITSKAHFLSLMAINVMIAFPVSRLPGVVAKVVIKAKP